MSRQAATWRRAKLRDEIAYAAMTFVDAADAYELARANNDPNKMARYAAVVVARQKLNDAVADLRASGQEPR